MQTVCSDKAPRGGWRDIILIIRFANKSAKKNEALEYYYIGERPRILDNSVSTKARLISFLNMLSIDRASRSTCSVDPASDAVGSGHHPLVCRSSPKIAPRIRKKLKSRVNENRKSRKGTKHSKNRTRPSEVARNIRRSNDSNTLITEKRKRSLVRESQLNLDQRFPNNVYAERKDTGLAGRIGRVKNPIARRE